MINSEYEERIMTIKTAKLSNEIDFIYKKNLNTPRVTFCLNFSINQPEKSAGIYAIMTQLFLEGTSNRNAEQLAKELDNYAIEFSADLKQDYLRFKFTCLNEDFKKALELLSDIVINTTFDEFEKEIVKAQGEISAKLDEPRVKTIDKYYETMFDGYYYGNTSAKILENLKNISKNDILEAYKIICLNSRKICVIVGDIDFDYTKNELENFLSGISKSIITENLIKKPELKKSKSTEIIKPDANQSHIVRGWLTDTYNSNDYSALALLNIILGASGLSSRLFQELREKQGLAYVVRSSFEPLALCGNFCIYIATEPKNIEISLKGFENEIQKIKTELISIEELENAKQNLFGKWAFLTETNNQQACNLAHYEIQGLGYNFQAKIKEKIKNVIPEDIKFTANKYFNDISVTTVLKP